VHNLTCEDEETGLTVIEGTLLFLDVPVHALIDPGATYSFVSHALVDNLKLEPRRLGYQIVIPSPMGATLETAIGCQGCIFNMGA